MTPSQVGCICINITDTDWQIWPHITHVSHLQCLHFPLHHHQSTPGQLCTSSYHYHYLCTLLKGVHFLELQNWHQWKFDVNHQLLDDSYLIFIISSSHDLGPNQMRLSQHKLKSYLTRIWRTLNIQLIRVRVKFIGILQHFHSTFCCFLLHFACFFFYILLVFICEQKMSPNCS